jgi:hypothetical protein
MYLYLYTFFFGLFLKLNGHLIVYNQLKMKYRKWNSLNKLVSTRNENYICVIYYSFKLLCQALYITLIQWLNNYIVKQDKNNYLMTYTINGKLYKNLIKVKRGPSPVLQISSENMEDVTNILLSYLGPSYNWHGNEYTPKLLGYKTLVFECADCNEKIYNDDDVIPKF